jgi:hypothetical protein
MKKEIKLRAWTGLGIIYPVINPNYTQGKLIDSFDDELLMRYSGLEDWKGQEIYEGDIISISINGKVVGNNEVVEWFGSSFWLRYRNRIIDSFFIGR